MTNLIREAERVVRHSRRFWLTLCAVCDRAVDEGAACTHADALLAQARRRLLELGEGTDETPPPRRGARARAVRQIRTRAVAA